MQLSKRRLAANPKHSNDVRLDIQEDELSRVSTVRWRCRYVDASTAARPRGIPVASRAGACYCYKAVAVGFSEGTINGTLTAMETRNRSHTVTRLRWMKSCVACFLAATSALAQATGPRRSTGEAA